MVTQLGYGNTAGAAAAACHLVTTAEVLLGRDANSPDIQCAQTVVHCAAEQLEVWFGLALVAQLACTDLLSVWLEHSLLAENTVEKVLGC
jgi:hypothetical protein